VRDQIAHDFDPPSYLRAMDAEGIDAAILFPSAGLFVPYLPELGPAQAERACRTYNEWIAAYCGEAPTRLAAVGLVPLVEVGRAVSVAEDAARLGLCGVVVRPNFLYGRMLGDPQYDRLYDCLESRGLVLALHEGLGVRGALELGSDRFRTFTARHACAHPMEQMAGLASLILEGALERHPGLRVAIFESGTGWLPYWLDRLDAHVEWMRGAETGHLTLSPSEYFQRQCVIAAEPEDSLVGWVVARHGAERVVWASDFPNPDSIYPEAVETFLTESSRAGLGERDLAAVLWDTPLRFFGLEHRLGNVEPLFSRR
jgi:predicted TIM-barrel fold metal-dependent hydrolase